MTMTMTTMIRMANEPLVCAIMLTRDRPAMAARAIESFRRQTYGNRFLVIIDNGTVNPSPFIDLARADDIRLHRFGQGISMGVLRNAANTSASCETFHNVHNRDRGGVRRPRLPIAVPQADIIVHFDDDDWSYPNRIADQVALLAASGADAVGFREMLFWRTPQKEAWLFTGATPDYALGTSLCYWRKTWQRRPFLNENQGVEEKWCADLKVTSMSANFECQGLQIEIEPRMIASIHGGNTSTGYDLERHVAMGSQQWRRVPEWDEYCRERMKL